MIGLDFPVRPEWVHDVHQLWRPHQPISELVQAALTQTMPELGGEKTRRNSLSIILRNFVKTQGGGQVRHTAEQDAWAAYSKVHPVSVMAPAYLAQIIAHNDVAQEATKWFIRRAGLGNTFTSGELRRYLIGHYGERKVVLNTGSAFLTTLVYFGILQPSEAKNSFVFVQRLKISRQVFPLIVWTLWRSAPVPQYELDQVELNAALAYFELGNLDDLFAAGQPTFWALSERIDSRLATLKATTEASWEDLLLHQLEGIS